MRNKDGPGEDFEDFMARNAGALEAMRDTIFYQTSRLVEQAFSWPHLVMNGDARACVILERGEINPDYPVSKSRLSPLSDLALINPPCRLREEAYAEIGKAMIAAGARLGQADYRGLYPADYAFVSPNRALAAAIIDATLISPQACSYRPRLEALFIIEPRPAIRAMMKENAAENSALIRKSVRQGSLLLGRDAEAYWLHFTPPKVFLSPDVALCRQFHRVAVMLQNPESSLAAEINIGDERKKLQILEICSLRKLSYDL